MRRAETDVMTCRRTVVLVWALAQALPSACSHQPTPVAKKLSVLAEEPAGPKAPPPAAEAKTAPVLDTHTSAADAIFFEFDSALLQEDARATLARIASEAKQRDSARLAVEGNCDDLGTVEYNLALGQHRAEAAKQYLVHMGVPSQRISTASYGSQRPRYPGQDDVSRSKNRRDDLVFRNLRDRR